MTQDKNAPGAAQQGENQNAFQRRRTMLSKEPVINPDDEAKVLGLKNPDAAVKVDVPVKKTADKDARMTR